MPLSEEQGVLYSVAGEILKFLWGLSSGGVGKDQSGFPEDLPVLKSLLLFRFLFLHLNTGHWANTAEVSPSLDGGGETDFHLP